MTLRRDLAIRWASYLAVAVAFAVLCGYLSNWQFSRNAERAELLATVERNYDAPAVQLGEVLAPGATLNAADQWRPVRLQGSYLPEHQVLARNRAHGGTSAFEVLVPFRASDGRILLIDRGWLRPGATSPQPDAIPAAPDGEVTVTARLRPGELLPRSGRTEAPTGQVPTINLPLIAEQTGLGAALEPGAYGLLASENPAPDQRPQPLPAPSEESGPYLSYAIQWILFAVMGFVFIGYVIRSERGRRGNETDQSPRRRDRDAEEEDAFAQSLSGESLSRER